MEKSNYSKHLPTGESMLQLFSTTPWRGLFMESKDNKEKSGVAKLRERFYEIKRKIKPSPELEEAVRQKKPFVHIVKKEK